MNLKDKHSYNLNNLINHVTEISTTDNIVWDEYGMSMVVQKMKRRENKRGGIKWEKRCFISNEHVPDENICPHSHVNVGLANKD
jgi:hypothetical protein